MRVTCVPEYLHTWTRIPTYASHVDNVIVVPRRSIKRINRKTRLPRNTYTCARYLWANGANNNNFSIMFTFQSTPPPGFFFVSCFATISLLLFLTWPLYKTDFAVIGHCANPKVGRRTRWLTLYIMYIDYERRHRLSKRRQNYRYYFFRPIFFFGLFYSFMPSTWRLVWDAKKTHDNSANVYFYYPFFFF